MVLQQIVFCQVDRPSIATDSHRRAYRRIFAVSNCAVGAWPQIQIVQLCTYALIAGQRDVFAFEA